MTLDEAVDSLVNEFYQARIEDEEEAAKGATQLTSQARAERSAVEELIAEDEEYYGK
jgi:hypothetical protein